MQLAGGLGYPAGPATEGVRSHKFPQPSRLDVRRYKSIDRYFRPMAAPFFL
jgi:hypothetical protein